MSLWNYTSTGIGYSDVIEEDANIDGTAYRGNTDNDDVDELADCEDDDDG